MRGFICSCLLLTACATSSPPTPEVVTELRQLHLAEKGGPFDGGHEIFILGATLIVETIPPGFPTMRRHIVVLDAASRKELDALVIAAFNTPDVNPASVPLSVDGHEITVDIMLHSRQTRSLFSANSEHAWFSSLRDWLIAHAKIAELVPPQFRGPYEPDWRPPGWAP